MLCMDSSLIVQCMDCKLTAIGKTNVNGGFLMICYQYDVCFVDLLSCAFSDSEQRRWCVTTFKKFHRSVSEVSSKYFFGNTSMVRKKYFDNPAEILRWNFKKEESSRKNRSPESKKMYLSVFLSKIYICSICVYFYIWLLSSGIRKIVFVFSIVPYLTWK